MSYGGRCSDTSHCLQVALIPQWNESDVSFFILCPCWLKYWTYVTQSHPTCPWFHCLFRHHFWSVHATIIECLTLNELGCVLCNIIANVEDHVYLLNFAQWVNIPRMGLWNMPWLVFWVSQTRCISSIAVSYIRCMTSICSKWLKLNRTRLDVWWWTSVDWLWTTQSIPFISELCSSLHVPIQAATT
jgi:hypothetical protein